VADPRSERIPLFPLGTVLYPGLVLPVHVFEERYRALVRDLVERPGALSERSFGVVAIRVGREVGTDSMDLHEIGCTAELRQVQAYEDGRYDLVTSGARRFRVLSLDTSLPYLQADVEWLDEPVGDTADVLAGSVVRAFRAYRDALLETQGLVAVDDDDALPDAPTVLSYLVAATMVLDVGDHQSLLAAPDSATRLLLELGLLRRESSLLRVLPSLPGVDYARQPAPPN
jgi:Lon protease-like protein